MEISDQTPELTATLIAAITHFYEMDDGSFAIDAVTSRGALIVTLSVFLEIDPSIKDNSDIKRYAEMMSKALRSRVRELRRQYEETGYRPWPVEVQRIN